MFPCARGHSLLIPKKPSATVLDMTEDDASNVLKEIPRLARAVKAFTGADGVHILQNSGSAAGQHVFHTHFHVIPRFLDVPNSLFNFIDQPPMISRDTAEELLNGIKSKL